MSGAWEISGIRYEKMKGKRVEYARLWETPGCRGERTFLYRERELPWREAFGLVAAIRFTALYVRRLRAASFFGFDGESGKGCAVCWRKRIGLKARLSGYCAARLVRRTQRCSRFGVEPFSAAVFPFTCSVTSVFRGFRLLTPGELW